MILKHRGSENPSMASTLMSDAGTDDQVTMAKGACASAYAGEYFCLSSSEHRI